jgi:hypothetical protein
VSEEIVCKGRRCKWGETTRKNDEKERGKGKKEGRNGQSEREEG